MLIAKRDHAFDDFSASAPRSGGWCIGLLAHCRSAPLGLGVPRGTSRACRKEISRSSTSHRVLISAKIMEIVFNNGPWRCPVNGQSGRRTAAVRAAIGVAVVLLGAVACSGSTAPRSGPSGTSSTGAVSKLAVVATINAWGSIASQLGGDRVEANSIITNPDTDPHSYEPSVADARKVADAKVVVENGIGYDVWAEKMIASDPNPQLMVINVGDTVGVAGGGNPHQWYSP